MKLVLFRRKAEAIDFANGLALELRLEDKEKRLLGVSLCERRYVHALGAQLIGKIGLERKRADLPLVYSPSEIFTFPPGPGSTSTVIGATIAWRENSSVPHCRW